MINTINMYDTHYSVDHTLETEKNWEGFNIHTNEI
jgi:hypothetical protein